MTADPSSPAYRTVSLYMSSTQQPTAAVDPYQAGGPSQALRVMDLRTLNPVAPDVLIESYDGGAWFSATICCGCDATTWCGLRVRIMQIDGTNSLSAVAFDTAPAPAPQAAPDSGLGGPTLAAVAAAGAVAVAAIGALVIRRLFARKGAPKAASALDPEAGYSSLN
jgi:hypothetical protein